MMGWERTDISDEVDEWIQDGRTGNQRIVEIFNIVQSIVLLGTVLYILLNKSIDYKQLVFAVIFIGGFLFHIVWEAKCQYTVVYFVLLIPYCIQGLQLVVQEIMKLITLPLQKINKKKMFVSVVIIALLSLMLMQDNIVITKTLKFYNAASEAEYNEYLKNREGVYHEWQNTQ